MSTKYCSAGIDPRQVDKAAGADFVVTERVFVSSQGPIIVDAGGEITEVSWRQSRAGQRPILGELLRGRSNTQTRGRVSN